MILRIACLNAAIAIHRGLLYNVLRQALYFFEIRPLGRIVNRFSKDITDIDVELPYNCYEVIESGLIVSFTLLNLVVLHEGPRYVHRKLGIVHYWIEQAFY